MMKIALLSVALVPILLASTSASFACRCNNPTSTKQAYDQADLVVKGTVASVSGDLDTEAGTVAEFSVSSAWKGSRGGTIKIINQSTCAFDFKKGQSYLVFLTKSADNSQFTTTICAGNLKDNDAGPAVNWLNNKAN